MNSGSYPVKIFLKEGKGKQKKIIYIKVDGQNRIKFRVEGNDETFFFDESKQSIIVGGKKIVPLYSYLINPWNVLLPYIAYEEDINNIKNYLKSIGSTMYSKEDNEKKNF